MNKYVQQIGLAILALVVAFTGTIAQGAGPSKPNVPHVEKGPFPSVSLPEVAGGQRAIDLLGSRLPEVAAWYGKSPDEFRSMLQQDRRMKLDRRGRVFYVDEHDEPVSASPSGADGSLLEGTLLPLEQTFLMHSRPGSKRTIYLNFRGATLLNTAWNSSGGSINAQPFDLDGVPSTFSNTELQRIQYIWQRVAEDYAPFDVNVTTEPPSPDKITRSGTTDDVYGTTVLITNSNGVYSCSCGGVAYLGIFDDTSDYYKPALVFYNQLASGSEKAVAEAISHEAGHNMGLSHDGTSSTGYYQGQGSGVTGWAPIMGVGYSRPLVQFSKGEYSGANNAQDDFAVMQTNGLPLRADDHGETPASATALVGAPNGLGQVTASASGVIERASDVDYFSFNASAGSASLTLNPAARSANLDAVLTLHNGSGAVITSANPVDLLTASITVTLPATGTYYASVKGTGKGDALVDGYTSYGSVGQYLLTATYSPSGNQPPVARITNSALTGVVPLTVNFSGSGSSDADGTVVAWDWNFGDGTTGTGATVSRVFATAGTYTVQLKVTDNAGLTGLSQVTVTAQSPVAVLSMRVADISMGLAAKGGNNGQATAAVKLVNASGAPVMGASVVGAWSGIVNKGGVSAITDASGVARFTSPNTKQQGTYIFTVIGATLDGYSYAPGTNTETSDSITR
ncbi:PKD domain-containing protein [Acidovorax sp. BL-A-41-H1]|uniref:PKD domain-containing protein n=1 Tax=Acidovorax sp. BL-A-41-H1 TaxID=3421102 RepID=UPI003F793DA6